MIKMKNLRFLLLPVMGALGIAIALNSCYYDVEEELYPSSECQTSDVAYQAVIAPILADNCLVCHSTAANLGNVTLSTYEQVKTYVDNGKLLGAIRHTPGFSAMPDGQPKLADCTIAKIEKWVQDGAPNN